jgi:hypothetical protein
VAAQARPAASTSAASVLSTERNSSRFQGFLGVVGR